MTQGGDQDSNGVCFGDLDNDGDDDPLVLGRHENNRLFSNNGSGCAVDCPGRLGMKRSHSNALRNGLTLGQERALCALLTAPSVAAAARQAGVGQSTLRRWLREDDNFQTELRQIREEALSHASLMLQQNVARAVCLMYELIETDAPVAPGRVTLIRTAIEYAFRSAVYRDTINRVRALEKTQRESPLGTRQTSLAEAAARWCSLIK